MIGKSLTISGNPTHPAFPWRFCMTFLLLGVSALPGCSYSHGKTRVSDKMDQTPKTGQASKANVLDGIKLTSMFDGEKLGFWKKTDFYQAGNAYVKDGCLILEKSEWMTGVTWTGPVISTNYEISFEAMRVEGDDFFCGLTFPVGKSSCSLILGGWSNQVCGLSSIDHKDASLNETTLRIALENNRWYRVTLRVTPDAIQASLDSEWIIDVDTTGKTIDVRPECIPNLPLGFATYKTTGAIRNIHLTRYRVPSP